MDARRKTKRPSSSRLRASRDRGWSEHRDVRHVANLTASARVDERRGGGEGGRSVERRGEETEIFHATPLPSKPLHPRVAVRLRG